VTPVELNTDVSHSTRIYDYLLGGKDKFAADRDAAARTSTEPATKPPFLRYVRE
jgi:hypothetical protein